MKRLLLDTNALLWTLDADSRLGAVTRQRIAESTELAVSVASLWEITIKVSLGKLEPVPTLLPTIQRLGLRRLGIEDAHLDVLATLPRIHNDPFDRMIIAQALAERLTVVTSDDAFAQYDVPTFDARA